jgi:hypothetical protein
MGVRDRGASTTMNVLGRTYKIRIKLRKEVEFTNSTAEATYLIER